MDHSDLERVFVDLFAYCRDHDFAGYDPFDGLNSKLFQASPLKHSRTARLLWTQFFKRSPVNFRKIARVPREQNAKGTALFALAALANFRRLQTKEAETGARDLLDNLIEARLTGFSGAAWGYNFDWQGRAFFAPRGTPTIVPTAFAARALCDAAQTFGDRDYLPLARTACDFILNDLNRSEETSDEVGFSYSPLDHTRVFNASLLAGETLATVGALTGEASICEWGMKAARYVVRRQREDGSWAYGADDYQSWADNFHTAFVLTSLSRIVRSCSSVDDREASTAETQRTQRGHREFLSDAEAALVRGYEFWRERFFLANGWPKYFPDRLYPADAHSAGAAIVALVELRERFPDAIDLANKIAAWTIEHLRDSDGYFSYQRRRFYTNKIAYMRWSQAWLAYALAECQYHLR